MNAFTLEEYQQFHLNQDRLDYCYQQKWFKLFVPKTYGGLELSMQQGCKTLLEVAEIQGGLGWTVNLGAGANWFAGFFTDQIAKELFTPEQVVIAGSGAISGNWKTIEQGYQISGEWTKCTGAHHATLFSLSADNPTTGAKTFVVPRKQVQLSKEKWPIMGMRNSSSFGINLNKSTVPAGYDFQINVIKNNHHYGVLHIPFQSFARLCMAASYLGVIKCLATHCRKELTRPEPLAIIEDTLAPMIEKAEKNLYVLANQVEKLSLEGSYTEDNQQKIRQELGQSNMDIFDVVQTLFLAGGLPFIEEDKLIHWAYRDVLTAVQHFMVKP